MRIIGPKTLPIGVDLGSSTLKMAQLLVSDGDISLQAARSVEVPRPCRDDLTQRLEFLCGTILRIRKAGAFKGRESVLALPAEATLIHQIKLPKLPPDQIEEALQRELPYPTEDVVVRHELAGEVYDGTEAKQELIVVAVAQATLDAYLDMAHRAKLDVAGVDIEAYAIVDCFARQFGKALDSPRGVLFVDLGAAATQVVFAHDNKVVFARNLTMGCEQLDLSIAKGMGVPVEDARALRRNTDRAKTKGIADDDLGRAVEGALEPLISELGQCTRYHDATFGDASIEQVIFAGGGAYDAGVCKTIAKQLNLRAQIGDPFAHIDCVRAAGSSMGLEQNGPKPDWAVAVGLGLRALTKAESGRRRGVPAAARR